MNYSHDNWSAILAHIGKPEELDTSARNAGALTRRREIRDAATLLRLGWLTAPGMSLREVTAWAQLHDVATLSDVALLKRLRNAADWFGILAAQTLCCTRRSYAGCTSGKRLRLSMEQQSCARGGSAEWRLHMDMILIPVSSLILELTDSRTLNGWTDLRKRQTRYALLMRFGLRPNVSAHLLWKLIISSGFTGEDCAG